MARSVRAHVKIRPSYVAVLALLSALHGRAVSSAEDNELAIVGATVHDGKGRIFENGIIVVRGGKIVAVGPADAVAVPPGAAVVDAHGKHATPGLIDLFSRSFFEETELRDFPGAEQRRAADAIDLNDAAWAHVRDEGILIAAVSPGLSQGAGGTGCVVKLGASGARVIAEDSHYAAALGVAASGERSTSAERLEQYYRLRSLFTSAVEYRKSWENHWKAVEKYNEEAKRRAPPADKPAASGATPGSAGGASPDEKKEPKKDEAPKDPAAGQPAPAPKPAEAPKPPRPPALDVGREALARAAEGKLPIFIEAHRKDDIQYALLLKKEFGLRLVILGATQARWIADDIARAGAPTALGPVQLDRFALELRDHDDANAAKLAAAKVPVAITSGGSTGLEARGLRVHACAAVRGGLPSEEALRGLTSLPAALLGLEPSSGSLEPGKDADIVLFDGEPLDARTAVSAVLVDGRWMERKPAPESWKIRQATTAAAGPAGKAAAGAANPPAATLPRSQRAATPHPEPAARPVVLRGARIEWPEGDSVRRLEHGTIVLRGGKVEAVGDAGSVNEPSGAEVIDAAGKWILPGFIDAHSHAGIGGETDDISSAVSEDLRVLDAFDPWDPELPRILSRGVTCVALSPGNFDVVGGVISLVKVVPAEIVARDKSPGRRWVHVVERTAGTKASLAPAMNLSRFPTSLDGALRSFEGWAKTRAARGEAASDDGAVRDLIVVEAPSVNTCERALASLSGLRAAILEGSRFDASDWLRLSPSRPVILGPYRLGEPSARLRSASILRSLGVRIAFGGNGTRRDALTSAALAVQAGLSRDDAFLALTLWPAELYGVGRRIGTLSPGADADLVIWTGDPFSLTARVEQAYVEGEPVLRPPEVAPRDDKAAGRLSSRAGGGGA